MRGRQRPFVLAFRLSEGELEDFNRALRARYRWNAGKHRGDFLRAIVLEYVRRAVGEQLRIDAPGAAAGKPETPAPAVNRDRGKPTSGRRRGGAK